jgi:hypothetical protein
LALLLSLARPSTARAADPPLCRAIAALDRTLDATLRARLMAICADRASASDEHAAVERALSQALSSKTEPWMIVLLAEALQHRPDLLPAAPAAEGYVYALRRALRDASAGKGPCREVFQRLERYAHRKSEDAPLTEEALKGACGAEVRQGNGDAGPPGDHVFMVLFGKPTDEVNFFWGGAAMPVGVASPVGIPVKDLQAFIALVPRDAVVTAVVVRADGRVPVPMLWGRAAERDLATLPLTPTKCLDVRLQGRPGATLFVDGHRIENPASRPFLGVTFDPHTVVAVDEDGTILDRQSISYDDLKATDRCLTVSLDAVRSDKVALVGLTTNSECVNAGVDEGRIAKAIADYFVPTGATSKPPYQDLRDWTAVVANVTGSNGHLMSLKGKPVGAPKGDSDPTQLIASAAAELVRQGYGYGLHAEMRCSRHGEGDWDYSFVLLKIDVEKLRKVERDPTTGADVDRAVSREVRVAHRTDALRDTVRGALAAHLNKPYVRIAAGRETVGLLDDVRFTVEARAPEGADIQLAWKVDEQGSDICGSLQEWGALRSGRPSDVLDPNTFKAQDPDLDPRSLGPQDFAGAPTRIKPPARDASSDAEHRDSTQVVLPFHPPGVGTYVIQVGLYEISNVRPRPRLAVAYRCVRVEDSSMRLWTSIGAGIRITNNRGGSEYFRALVGLANRPRGPIALAVGPVLGYLVSAHRAPASSAWELPADGPYDARGDASLSWVRHAFLIGLDFAPHLSWCKGYTVCNQWDRGLELALHVIPVLDVGFIDTGSLIGHGALKSFLGGAAPGSVIKDVDWSVFFNLEVRYRFVQAVDLSFSAELAILGLDDQIGRAGDATKAGRIGYNGQLYLGAGFSAGFAP